MFIWRFEPFFRRLKRIVVLSALVTIPAGGLVGYSLTYPDISSLKTKNPKKTSFMQLRENEWERKGRKKKVVQQWIPLANISPFLVDAVLIREDDKFWNHDGFDIDGIQNALIKDIKELELKAGGSTITQQLAKNLFLSAKKTPTRKLREAIITWRMEQTLSKRRILELYLNVAEWGDGIFGAEAAARHYFNKPATELTLEEATRLAIALPNPRKINPIGDSEYVTEQSANIYRAVVKRHKGEALYEGLEPEPEG
ncbi:MAG: monofunctional biosynthetic peptidoglycan transglycosylase [Nitrospinota bacterium]|nr:monofunctional biosynthetic peptidoglycan transglycosylase [Nitrospinota bacterium]